ncbi:MAG: glycine cleavage system aminomethyltransferase GcvT [Pirellulales bacterium]|nr:glycine cleavage system aminomethyltransferase GcvT [Pirellulales bacterium]
MTQPNLSLPLLQTPLHAWHAAAGGRMVEFGGWSMPVQYSSIVAEHTAVRTVAGLFDVSHMGRLLFSSSAGDSVTQVLAAVDGLTTRRVSDLAPGQIRYSLLTNDAAGILDDVLVYHVPAGISGEIAATVADTPAGEIPPGPQVGMVVNASNRQKVIAWLRSRLPRAITVHDLTASTAMIAVQGPDALGLVARFADFSPATLKYYHCGRGQVGGVPALISRTGYTGEDGCELIIPAGAAVDVWQKLLQAGQTHGVMACGLGARDTLRLEAAMPLYGHELDESTTPLEAGLGFAVTLGERSFPGHALLQSQKESGVAKTRVGLTVEGKRAPREQYPVHAAVTNGANSPDPAPQIGVVTSGTYSPTLERGIAMAYVPPGVSAPGTELQINLRGTLVPVTVVPLPFYKRK